jgi:hypothetical protein
VIESSAELPVQLPERLVCLNKILLSPRWLRPVLQLVQWAGSSPHFRCRHWD